MVAEGNHFISSRRIDWYPTCGDYRNLKHSSFRTLKHVVSIRRNGTKGVYCRSNWPIFYLYFADLLWPDNIQTGDFDGHSEWVFFVKECENRHISKIGIWPQWVNNRFFEHGHRRKSTQLVELNRLVPNMRAFDVFEGYL